MQLQLRDNLPFVVVQLSYQGRAVEIPDVLVDTGSGGTILAADVVAAIGIVPEASDILHTIHGVGGSEVVFMRSVGSLTVGEFSLENFEIEVGGMDYGFAIRGILGMDFMLAAGARINLDTLRIEFG